MKKLIIAAAIVCAAVLAQAATVQWDGFDIMDINGESYTGTAILHCVGIDSVTASSSIVEGELSYSSFSDELLLANTSYEFYFTSTDVDGNTYKSEIQSAKMPATGAASISFEGAGTWTPVPEPTSGLLLLLGVAGLALKRKRA